MGNTLGRKEKRNNHTKVQTYDEAQIRTGWEAERKKGRNEQTDVIVVLLNSVLEGCWIQFALFWTKMAPKYVQNGIKIGLGGTPVEGLGIRSQKERQRPGKKRPQRPSLETLNRQVGVIWRHFFKLFPCSFLIEF